MSTSRALSSRPPCPSGPEFGSVFLSPPPVATAYDECSRACSALRHLPVPCRGHSRSSPLFILSLHPQPMRLETGLCSERGSHASEAFAIFEEGYSAFAFLLVKIHKYPPCTHLYSSSRSMASGLAVGTSSMLVSGCRKPVVLALCAESIVVKLNFDARATIGEERKRTRRRRP